jgi:hypothetical protein
MGTFFEILPHYFYPLAYGVVSKEDTSFIRSPTQRITGTAIELPTALYRSVSDASGMLV